MDDQQISQVMFSGQEITSRPAKQLCRKLAAHLKSSDGGRRRAGQSVLSVAWLG